MSFFKRPRPKPEFYTFLADKQVKIGEHVLLQCEIKTEKVNVIWEKNGHKLDRVEGKHRTAKNGTRIFLEIRNAEAGDEGNYTVIIENSSGRVSCNANVTVELNPWRTIQCSQDPMISYLKTLRISREDVSELRFLLHGPVGAGKSSIINTVKNIFEGHQFINCLAAAEVTKSYRVKFKKYSLGNVPLVMYDVMGLEDGDKKGVHTEDIINALKGHIADNYAFNPASAIDATNRYNIHNPTLNDRMHCLVSVIPTDRISLMDDDTIQKMKVIRAAATKLGIPQVLFMTRVDQACRLTQNDLGKIYQSKKIRDKMMECSNKLGVPVSCIFPVKNYSEENKSDEKLNCLMLEAFTHIVNSANDYVKRSNEENNMD